MAKTSIKTFKYDVLVEREDICNREAEIKILSQASSKQRKIVLFAPRRYGKTSLLKNVIAQNFQKSHKKSLIIYVDFMDVKSLASIAERLQYSLSQALLTQFPLKTLLSRFKDFFKNLSLRIELDPNSGVPSLQVLPSGSQEIRHLRDLMAAIGKLMGSYRVMLILDEFQDITFVEEAEALLRSWLQELGKSSVFILGSKRHLLNEMFGSSRAPFFGYGDERHLSPIAISAWLPYFRERFKPVHLTIDQEAMQFLTERLYDVPNAICEIGAWLTSNYHHQSVTPVLIQQALDEMIRLRQSYAYRIQTYKEKEIRVLSQIAHAGFVVSPQAHEFVKSTGVPKSSLGKIIHKFLDLGILEEELNRGFRLSDPILGHFLARR